MLAMHSCAAPPKPCSPMRVRPGAIMRGAPPEPPAAITPSRQVPAGQLTSAIVPGPTLQALGTEKSLATADRQDLCYGETPVREPTRTIRAAVRRGVRARAETIGGCPALWKFVWESAKSGHLAKSAREPHTRRHTSCCRPTPKRSAGSAQAGPRTPCLGGYR